MSTNIFYTNVLKNVEKTLSSNTNIKVNIDKFIGTESIRLLPVTEELIEESNRSVTYRYTVLLDYKNNRTLDSRQITQVAHDIRTVLDKTKLNIASTLFFDGEVIEVIYNPELEEEGNEVVDLTILFSCSVQELLT